MSKQGPGRDPGSDRRLARSSTTSVAGVGEYASPGGDEDGEAAASEAAARSDGRRPGHRFRNEQFRLVALQLPQVGRFSSHLTWRFLHSLQPSGQPLTSWQMEMERLVANLGIHSAISCAAAAPE